MANATAAPVQTGDRLQWIAVAGGVVFLLLGAAGWFAGLHSAGMALRWLGVLCFAAAGLCRPSLMTWTFVAMVAGVELGCDAPGMAAEARLPADLFLRLIRMIVAPLLLSTIPTGIAGYGDLRSVGRVALKALVFFEVVTTAGLAIGLVAMNLAGAGWGVGSVGRAAPSAPAENWQQFVLNIFPENIAQAVAQNRLLQVAVFALLFGTALALVSAEKRAPVMRVLESLAEVMFRLTRIVMLLAPLAAGGALAYAVGRMGAGTLLAMAKLVGTFYAALAVFFVLVVIPILVAFRIPVRKFFEAAGEPAAIGFATTTSEAALPLAMERMEEFGVPRGIVAFVIPTGYSFNLIGASLYLSMAAVFVAQAAGIHLSVGRQIAMLAVLMLASKGMAGVPKAVLVVLMATAASIGLPQGPILLILGVDTVIDMGRAMMNVLGNCMASVIVARSEGQLAVR